ncbi:MAG: chemotaxis protein CheX [Campylobacterota bacterium]|nr:chemotaxis protein CheX [Campylobacterota bacterium]
MRATLKNGIAVFTPQGFLDGNSSDYFINLDDIETTKKLDVNLILVSLRKVIFFNRNGLDTFIKMFQKVSLENSATLGFCDCDDKKYDAITKFYKDNLTFSLFSTLEVASLFSSNYKDDGKNILLYSEDKSQRTAMAIELHDFGHNPIIAQSKKEFLEKKEQTSLYDVIIEKTFLAQVGNQVSTRVSGNAIIYTVSSFLDSSLGSTFNIQYHKNSLNVGFRLFIFDTYKVVAVNIHAITFFSKLASFSAEYNATICFVGLTFDKIPEAFKEQLEDAGLLFYETMDDILKNKELLDQFCTTNATSMKNKKTITKKIITELPNFIQATVSTIEMMTNSKAIKEAANVNKISIDDKNEKLASSIGFYGDMEGVVILVFPTEIAKKACELLLGEQTDDVGMILDTLAELGNIVAGKIKMLLSSHDININITLPRTYSNIDSLLDVVGTKKGVQVDLAFDNDKFLFFLTR